MATNIGEAARRREDEADAYLSTLAELGDALTAERGAHARLMALARRIERQDERRRKVAG